MHSNKVCKITLVKADIVWEFGIPKWSKQKFALLEDFKQDDNKEVNPPPLSTPTPPALAPTTPMTASVGDENDVAALSTPSSAPLPHNCRRAHARGWRQRQQG